MIASALATETQTVADMNVRRAQRAIIVILIILAALWIIQIVNNSTGYILDGEYGIQPRILADLPFILTAPFLHASWLHIEGNSLPLLILGFLAAFRSIRKFIGVTAAVILTSGLAVWLTAPAGSYTIGASGVIAGWLGYVILLGLLAAFLYLGAFDFLPNNSMISWQNHLGGLIGGLACAWIFRTRRTNREAVPVEPPARLPDGPTP